MPSPQQSPKSAVPPNEGRSPEPTSTDESALLILIESLNWKYRHFEDVGSTAYAELLAERGPVFPLSALVVQAQRVRWRQQADRRRNPHVQVLEDIPELDENSGPVVGGVVIADRRSPEAQALARDELRQRSASPVEALKIKRCLNGRLSSTDRSWLTRHRPRRKRVGVQRIWHRRILISSVGWGIWR